MLVMSRRQGETVLIGDDIEILDSHIGRSRRAISLTRWNSWNGYAAALAGGKLTDAKLAEAVDLIAWSRPFLLRGREQAAVRLRALHVAGAYGSCPGGPNARVRVSL
jgi:hypothetical protein